MLQKLSQLRNLFSRKSDDSLNFKEKKFTWPPSEEANSSNNSNSDNLSHEMPYRLDLILLSQHEIQVCMGSMILSGEFIGL